MLIGMLDSPYVRRVAISLRLLGLGFEHRPISVFRAVDDFRRINPVIKAPTLVCDDGTVLMDSTLILDYAEALARPRTLMPAGLDGRRAALRCIGLALAACDKGVQIIYERSLRPPEKQHAPWVERVRGQLLAALAELEAEVARKPLAPARADTIDQAGVTSAVAWHFLRTSLPESVDDAAHPRLAAYSAEAERLADFRAAPHGAGTVAAAGA